jgi:hypothetical protein
MSEQERRQFRRLRLRLEVAAKEGAWAGELSGVGWTSNISAGGMYMYVPTANAPDQGVLLSFELSIPPGHGYSSSVGTIRGTGQVVRTDQMGQSQVGMALQFTQPLFLEF